MALRTPPASAWWWALLTFRHAKGGLNGLHQPQHEEGTGTHVTQEEHEANAAPELRAKGSTYHVWVRLRLQTASQVNISKKGCFAVCEELIVGSMDA